MSDDREIYDFPNGYSAKREHCTLPEGRISNGNWVLRNEKGEPIDADRYRNDLFDRHKLER